MSTDDSPGTRARRAKSTRKAAMSTNDPPAARAGRLSIDVDVYAINNIPRSQLPPSFKQGGGSKQRNPLGTMAQHELAIRKDGDTIAMFRLGFLLERGAEGVPQDAVRAKALYERAIEKGTNVSAMYRLGVLLERGAEGVPQDAVRAKALYERAIEEGQNVNAMFRLGRLLLRGAAGVVKDEKHAADLFTLVINEQVHAEAMLNLGALLADGAEGVEGDSQRAVELFERSISEAEDVDTLIILALLLQTGSDDMAKDLRRATELLSQTSNDGHHMDPTNQLGAYLAVAHRPEFHIAARNYLSHFEEKVRRRATAQQSLETRLNFSSLEMQRKNSMKHVLTAVVPFFDGWKLDLIIAVTGRDASGKSAQIELHKCDEEHLKTNESSSSLYDGIRAFKELKTLFLKLGMSEAQDFEAANVLEVQAVFSQLVTRTTWEDFEQLDDRAAITYADFHQVLDGVITGKIKNCLLDCEETSELPTYAISANVPGSPICLGVRFMGADAYVDYKGYVRRIASFQSKTGSDMARLHVDGPWLAGRGIVRGTVHDIGPVEVAGPRSLTKVVTELSGENCSPSRKTIASWRKEFAVRLSTSDLWFSWRKVHSKCEVLRCKKGRMVVATSVLTFVRSLGASISKEPGLEVAQEETATDSEDTQVCFEAVTALVGAKAAPEALRDATDDEIARALYISSSWFSIMVPTSRPGHDCVWGNKNRKQPGAEIVEWLPTTREIMMAGWKLVPRAVTPTGRNWGPLQNGHQNISTERDTSGRQKCHLAPMKCIGPVHSDPSSLRRCVWGHALALPKG